MEHSTISHLHDVLHNCHLYQDRLSSFLQPNYIRHYLLERSVVSLRSTLQLLYQDFPITIMLTLYSGYDLMISITILYSI